MEAYWCEAMLSHTGASLMISGAWKTTDLQENGASGTHQIPWRSIAHPKNKRIQRMDILLKYTPHK
eukprot:1488978-Amphidinium_carterae.1